MEFIEVIDRAAVNHFHFIENRPILRAGLVGIAYLGDLVVLLLVLLYSILVLQGRKEPRAAWLVAATFLIAALLTYAGKRLVDRDWSNMGWVPIKPAEWELKSFPSGYAVLSTVVYGCLGVMLARRAAKPRLATTLRVLAFVLPFLAGVTRMFIGHNFVSDVIAGWAMGTLLVLVCVDLDKRWLDARPQAAGGTT